MDLNITHLVKLELRQFSASRMELGEDAGSITWNNAMESGLVFVSTEEEKQEARDYIRSFGAWDTAEIEAWNDTELNALILQFITGDLREYLDAKKCGRTEFKKWQENCGGSIYQNGQNYYYYLGN